MLIDNNIERLSLDVIKKSSNKKEEHHIYQGYEVRKLIKDKYKYEQIEHIEFISNDGLTVAVGIEEILVKNNVILADKADNKDISEDEKYRLIIAGDTFGRRWCKGICEIEIVEV